MRTDRPLPTRTALAMMATVPRRGRGFWFGLAIDLLWPPTAVFTRWRIGGGKHVPRSGGVLLAANHLSTADPIMLTVFALAHGRVPRFLAKADLWRLPVVRRVMAGGGHIPVHRGAQEAVRALHGAAAAAERGECVVVFPEGTFTDDAGHWPSTTVQNGLALLALRTGVPVVPVAVWGTHELMPDGGRVPRLLPRRTVHLVAGPPVDLSDLRAGRPSRRAMDTATARVMAAITDQLAEIRATAPPAG